MSNAKETVDIQVTSSVSDGPKVLNMHGMDERRIDKAAKFLSKFDDEEMPELSPEEERKIVRKVDWHLLPVMLISCTLPAVDKSCLSTAKLYGLATDIHLEGQQYSWLGSILFFGAMIGMYPNIYLVQRFNTGKVFSIYSMIWSALTLLICATHNFASIAVIRFFMGWFESVITPIAVAMIQNFYTKKEQPVRMTIIFAAITSTITGFLSWLVGQFKDDALPKWKYLFLLLGCISMAWAIFMFFFLPESPIDSRFLTKRERYYVVKRVSKNHTGVVSNVWKWSQVSEVFLDERTWIIFFFNICVNIPNGGLSTFMAILFNNLGYDAVISALLTMPTGIASTVLALISSYFAGKTTKYRCLVVIISLIFPLIGTCLNYGLPYSNLAGQMVGIYFLYGYYGPYLVGISLTQANTAGYTKRNVAFAWYYIAYSVGNIIGPQTFRASQAPQYTGGTIAMLVCYFAAMGLMVLYWLSCTYRNKTRTDETLNPDIQKNQEEETDDYVKKDNLMDKTDFEVTNFLYVK